MEFKAQPPPHSYRPPCSKESSAELLSPSHAFPPLHLAPAGPPARQALPFPLLLISTLLFQLELKPLPEPFQPPCPLCSLPPQNSGNTYCRLHCSSLSHVQLDNLAGVVGAPGAQALVPSLRLSWAWGRGGLSIWEGGDCSSGAFLGPGSRAREVQLCPQPPGGPRECT